MAVNITFLKDGEAGQPVNIANQLAQFINEAQSSLHIAIYDFRLKAPEVAEPVINALTSQANAGIEVKIAYYVGKPSSHTHKGEKPAVVEMDMDEFAKLGGDPAPSDIGDFLANPPENIQVKGIYGSKLMHNKYIVRDIHTDEATVQGKRILFTNSLKSRIKTNLKRPNHPLK